MAKLTILYVGNYNRRDYLDMLAKSKEDFNFFFLEFASKKDIKNDYYRTYGKAILWGDYLHVYDLLKKINPHKVLFIFIESYYHVLLNLACKHLGIPTYLIDHGMRDININVRLEKNLISQKWISPRFSTLNKFIQLSSRLKARMFLRRSIKQLPDAYATFFRKFYSARSGEHFIAVSKKLSSPLRLADAYITYSRKVYEVHQYYDHLSDIHKVHIIGAPIYDHLAGILPRYPFKKHIIMLDQGLSCRNLFGWDEAKYKTFIREFFAVCVQHGYHIFVKLHPIQPKREESLWTAYENITLVDSNELTKLLPTTNLIIGFFSTHLLPLMALPFTSVVTLENHPIGRINVSKSFVEAGVAHPIYDLDELHAILKDPEALHQAQLPHKQKFIDDWMYKFDGKAGDRLRDILLREDL